MMTWATNNKINLNRNSTDLKTLYHFYNYYKYKMECDSTYL